MRDRGPIETEILSARAALGPHGVVTKSSWPFGYQVTIQVAGNDILTLDVLESGQYAVATRPTPQTALLDTFMAYQRAAQFVAHMCLTEITATHLGAYYVTSEGGSRTCRLAASTSSPPCRS